MNVLVYSAKFFMTLGIVGLIFSLISIPDSVKGSLPQIIGIILFGAVVSVAAYFYNRNRSYSLDEITNLVSATISCDLSDFTRAYT